MSCWIPNRETLFSTAERNQEAEPTGNVRAGPSVAPDAKAGT